MRNRNLNWQCHALLAILMSAVAVPAFAVENTVNTGAKTKPSATDSSAKNLHLSPLATEGPKPKPITPPKPEEIKAAIQRGVKFLLDDQRRD
ncbi:MAG TPA: hypothetical protein VFW73_10150, partial [Lacipirellulaceae bacterium]|nr:hypothetical protein [Lacipirellulaceae bacterium]